MSRPPPDLFSKLDLALMRANMSKGRLAAEARVDKSLVGRWARGLVMPSEHNLAVVTEILARRFPGLTLESWSLPMEAFASRIGGAPSPAFVRTPPPALPADLPELDSRSGYLLSRTFAVSRTSMGRDRWNGLGVYLGFRHGLAMGGRLICDLYVVWREDEDLRFRQFGISFGHEGHAIVLRSQVYMMGENVDVNNSLYLAILVGVQGSRAIRMDGIMLTVAGHHRLNSPAATTIVLQRIADLPATLACPDRTLIERMLSRIKTIVAEDALKPHIAADILAAISTPQSLRPHDGAFEHTLMVPTEHSLSRNEPECDEATARYIRRLRETFLAEDAAALPMAPIAGVSGFDI